MDVKIVESQHIFDKFNEAWFSALRQHDCGEAEFTFPYTCKLSFLPIIRHWKSKLESEDKSEVYLANRILDNLKNTPELFEPIDDWQFLNKYKDAVGVLLASLTSPAYKHSKLTLVATPFVHKILYITPALIDLFDNTDISFNFERRTAASTYHNTLRASTLILDRLYDTELLLDPACILQLFDSDKNRYQYFKPKVNFEFVDVKQIKESKRLTDRDIYRLLNNLDDINLWAKTLPPDCFEFHGFITDDYIDITKEEAISRIKDALLDKRAVLLKENIAKIEKNICILLNTKDVTLGITSIDFPDNSGNTDRYRISHNLLAGNTKDLLAEDLENSIYFTACRKLNAQLVNDLKKYIKKTENEIHLLQRGIRSLLVVPLYNSQKKIIGILELAHHKPNVFNAFTIRIINKVVHLFAIAMERSREEIDNKIKAIIRENFTALHPSVEWKFNSEAFNIYHAQENGQTKTAKPIVFNDVFPLFGQIDIVQSSVSRNQAIKDDLIQNLSLILIIFKKTADLVDMPIVWQYIKHIQTLIQGLHEEIKSEDEYKIVHIIKGDYHDLLNILKYRQPNLKQDITKYFEQLDRQIGVIYSERKAFEESVRLINNAISEHLEAEEKKNQLILPHYFEKYKTDGVEYNMYIGKSLLKQEIGRAHV